MANVFAKKLHVEMDSWLAHDMSEVSGYHLNLYLDFQGRNAFSFEQKGDTPHLVRTGFRENSYYNPIVCPLVTENKFKVKLRAIERDGPFDGDDRAAKTIEIDLDRDPPHSTWSMTASADGTDLKIQVWFNILTLEYTRYDDGKPTTTIQDQRNWPFPWNDIRLFQHQLGLGHNVTVPLRPQNIISERPFWIWQMPNGPARKSLQRVYRYEVTELGIPHDTVSSIFLPHKTSVILHEHQAHDSRFDPAKGHRLGTFGLHNLREIGWDDQLSTIDVMTTIYPSDPVN